VNKGVNKYKGQGH